MSKVASCILYGLKSLHECGKVHRDLKPENVLQKSNGDFALTDFGISGDRNKRMTERNILGKPTQIFGTYAYMPPEQVNPKREATVLPTTDIFSFGALMYQLITNELPFGSLNDERSLIPYLKNAREGNWNRQLLVSSPEGNLWAPLVDGCLKPDFRDRFQNVDAVLDTVPHVYKPIIEETINNVYQKKVINGLMLRVMQGEDYGITYLLDDLIVNKGNSILTMGRSFVGSQNDIQVKEEQSSYISRRHCTLELDYEIGEWVIRDGQWDNGTVVGSWRNSTNGTFVNSSEVCPTGMVIKPGDIISVKENSLEHKAIKNTIELNIKTPAFVEFDNKKLTGTFLRLPERNELNAEINESLIVEFYNR
jgi:serine/threonine protein kinase